MMQMLSLLTSLEGCCRTPFSLNADADAKTAANANAEDAAQI